MLDADNNFGGSLGLDFRKSATQELIVKDCKQGN